jgi:microcin C transport system substrate-binding protein
MARAAKRALGLLAIALAAMLASGPSGRAQPKPPAPAPAAGPPRPGVGGPPGPGGKFVFAPPKSPVVWTPESLPFTGHVTTSYGFSVVGGLKYPADFKHLDYVNPDAPKGGIFRGASLGTFDSLNGYVVLGSAPLALALASPERETLMARSGDEPASQYGLLAESITYPDDMSWVEYKLRPEARWHDGTPVTVRDVLFTVDFLMTKGNPVFRFRYPALLKVVQTGPSSVRFIFGDKFNRTEVQNAGDTPILCEHWYKDHHIDITQPSLVPALGSGPYKATKVIPGRAVVFDRVKDYWGRNLPLNVGRYNFDTYRVDFYRDDAALFEAFMAGAYDYRLEIAPAAWATKYNRPAVRKGLIKRDAIPVKTAGAYTGLDFNLRIDKFKDPRVREAISHTLDFGFLNRVFFYGMYSRTRSYFPNSRYEATGLPSPDELKLLDPWRSQLDPRVFTAAYQPAALDGGWASRRTNLLEARSLLFQAGYVERGGKLVLAKTGQPLRIEFLLQDPSYENVIGTVVKNLDQLGVDAVISLVDPSQYAKRINQHEFDVIVGIGFPISAAPGAELSSSFLSSAIQPRGGGNIRGLRSPLVDQLMKTLVSDPDMNARLAAGRAADRVLTWGFYSVPLYRLPTINIAYWDKFGRPKIEPDIIGLGMPSNWWFDARKDGALKSAGYAG